MDNKPQVILFHETLRQSIIKDIVSAISLIAVVLVGYWFEDVAMQVIVLGILIIFGLSRLFLNSPGRKFNTRAEAIAHLEDGA